MTPTLLLGSDIPDVLELRAHLDADDLVAVPSLDDPSSGGGDSSWPWAEDLERWRDDAAAPGPAHERVVVAAWPSTVGEPEELAATDLDRWLARAEVALARWYAALGVAARRCADGGAVVAVVERPPPLDAAGWAPESSVADAVESMVRSLARSEGPRGVRVNAVTTPLRLARPPVVDPAPSLASFPGTLASVAGSVRLLLSPDAAALTGTIVNADHGRSWR